MKIQQCISTLIILSLITINLSSTNIKADLLPELTHSGGILITGVYYTYLQNVNVSLKLYDEKAVCTGTFILRNPSNVTENMTLHFDPGNKPLNSVVYVDEIEVYTIITSIEDTNHRSRDVPTFYVEIEQNSSIEIKIDWEMKIKENWRRLIMPFIIFKDYEEWSAHYLIIGTRSWNRNIESVTIIFDVRTDGLKNCIIKQINETGSSDIQPVKKYKNEDGFYVYVFSFQNFSYPFLTLSIYNQKSNQNFIPAILIWGTLIIIILILIIRKRRKKRSKEKKNRK